MNEILEESKNSFNRFEDSFIENIILKRTSELKMPTNKAYIDFLVNNVQEEKIFAALTQNHYSEFFRNPLTFSVLEKIIFPMLLEEKKSRNREVRIWSAACASGQEPYSIAMLLEEYLTVSREHARYRIFATDQSTDQIIKAERGIFDSGALDSISLSRLKKWFIKSGNYLSETYMVNEKLKKNIVFSVFDLLDEQLNVPPNSIFGDFDIVFCANLLFYYKPAYRKLILEKVKESLSSNGLLVVGETERSILQQEGFREIYYQSGIFHF